MTEDGVEVTDAAARLSALEGDDTYLLRLANQSLFGDCLVALGEALDASGAQAAVSNTAAGATYHVALGREASLEGRLRVTVNVPSSTASASSDSESSSWRRRLALGADFDFEFLFYFLEDSGSLVAEFSSFLVN